MCPYERVCMCVCVLPLIAPTPPDLSNGKICSRVPAGPTVAYLCGFISELPGASGPHPAFIRSPEHRMEGGMDG